MGGQHGQQIGYDESRTKDLQAAGFRVLRFWNNEVLEEIESVREKVWLVVQELSSHPPPNLPLEGEEQREHKCFPPLQPVPPRGTKAGDGSACYGLRRIRPLFRSHPRSFVYSMVIGRIPGSQGDAIPKACQEKCCQTSPFPLRQAGRTRKESPVILTILVLMLKRFIRSKCFNKGG